MSLPFFYEDFDIAETLVLSDANMHYMMHVLRMKLGEQCWITNGKGTRGLATITSTSKKTCTVYVSEVLETDMPKAHLHLAIAFTKNPSRIEWLLEKATEIGIATITPLITHRSEKLHWKKDRYEKILISAMLQSQQTFLPKLNDAIPLKEVLLGDEEIKCIAWCEEQSEKIALASALQKDKKTIILIGPEGDFTTEEVHLCIEHNCKTVSLGDTRLRTETAGLYACVVYNSLL